MIKLIEINNIEEINNLQYVNDLTVENNHNYIANNYIVHNCITTSNVSIHYPQASLINECYQVKQDLKNETLRHGAYDEIPKYNYDLPKIVADGGIRNYDHVIKALALGADYIMIGSVFAKCIESSGEKTYTTSKEVSLRFPIERYKNFRKVNDNWWADYTDEYIKEASKTWEEDLNKEQNLIKSGKLTKDDAEYKLVVIQYNNKIRELKAEKLIGPLNVKFFGMASADGQIAINGEKTKTAEGITKYLPVEYTLSGWVENMTSYLRSAMSYTNCKTLKDFIGKPTLIVNSISEIQVVNK